MPEFHSRWLDWEPSQGSSPQTAKTDESSRPTDETWDGETAELIKWFLTSPPPTESFEISKGVVVLKPALWWGVMRRELVLGPQGTPRARAGALQQDLRRLAALMKKKETT